jgi:signal transduction histidine kinase
MKKTLKAISAEEIKLLNELVDNLINLANDDAVAAIKKMRSLAKNRSFAKQKQLYATVMSKLGEYYGRHGKLDQASKLFEQMINYGRKHKIKRIENKALSNLAVCKAQMGDFMDAVETWKLLLSRDKNLEQRIHLLNNISAGYGYVGDGGLSLQYGFDALNLAEDNNLELLKVSPLINIGTAYERDSLHQKALDYWLIAMELAKKYDQIHSLHHVLNNIALAYSALGNKDLALQYAFESYNIRENHSFSGELASPLNNIGFIYETNDDLDQALEYYQRALKLYRQSKDMASMANCLANFGSIFSKKGDLATAQEYLEEAWETVNATDAQAIKIRIGSMLAELYAKLGDFEKAYEYMRVSSERENEHYEKLMKNSISVNEANYYKRKIEHQSDAYRLQNKELRKKNKLIQKATRDLQESNTALNDTVEVLNWLVSVISHDVRAPLANFNRVLAMMLDGSFDQSEHVEILESLKRSGENVFKLVDEMLDGIRLQRRKLNLNVDLVQQDLVPILKSVFAIYLPIAMQKRIALNYDFGSEKILALVDADLFKIVIRNLLNNALKFTDEKGAVTISTALVGDMVELSVSDTGRGMDSKTLQALQDGMILNSAKDNLRDGIGLGLALCRNAIKRMNSSLDITSSPGKGTTIRMKFPSSAK